MPLLMLARETMGREASPSTGVIDSQSVKTTGAGLGFGLYKWEFLAFL